MHSSKAWRWFRRLVVLVHLALVFWRPLTSSDLQNGYPLTPQIIEWLCLLFEGIDLVLLYLTQFEWTEMSKNPLISPNTQQWIFGLRAAVWILVVVDVLGIVFLQFSISRFMPIFRPLIFVLSNDKLIGALYAMIATFINAADALFLFLMILCIASVTGLVLFRFAALMNIYDYLSFQNFMRSFFTSFVFIVSGENYTELVYVSMKESAGYLLYFILLTLIGSWIVVSLIVSRFQTSFKQIYDDDRRRKMHFKRTGLFYGRGLVKWCENARDVVKC